MAGRIEEEKNNLAAKKALIDEIKALTLPEKRQEALASLKSFPNVGTQSVSSRESPSTPS
jgi:hypothetical protein